MKRTLLVAGTILCMSLPCSSSAETPVQKKLTPEPTVVAPAKNSFNSLFARELQKRAEYKEKFYVLPKAQKEKNQAKAIQYHKKGRSLFDSGNSKLAQRYYEKAIALDPFVDSYNYELAICAYRNGQHQRSLALLEMVRGTDIDETEIAYYQALNTMKLNEPDNAIKQFSDIVEENDPELSPSAAMYRGLLLKQQLKYDEAKASFQYVLDTAKDPNLDRQAERQIEEIISTQRFEEEGRKRFSYSVFTGLMYDSNVLNIANNNSSLDLEAYRLMYGGILEYKAIHKMAHSLTPRLSASDLYSVDNSFDSDATIQSTDPLQAELALPYTYRFALGKKAASLTFVPSYSNIFMSLDEQSRELVYSTVAVGALLTTSYGTNWINTTRLDVASDTFHPETTADNDQTAMKYALTFSNMRLFDSTGAKAISFDINYIMNDAEGDNSIYDRLLVSLGATYPATKKWISYGKLDYITQDFSKSATDRSDAGFIVTAGALYPITQSLSFNFYAQYYKNNSNVVLYDFDKTSVMTMFSYSSGFF